MTTPATPRKLDLTRKTVAVLSANQAQQAQGGVHGPVATITSTSICHHICM
jgi:hypothetical protein